VLATAFSGLIAAGVFSGLDGARGLTGWRWLFIIESSASFFMALVAMFIMPDYPESKTGSASWLMTEEERRIAQDRIARDRVSKAEANRSVWYGVKLAAIDYRTWIFVSLHSCMKIVERG
jgi:sugar phosphate permease